MKGAKSYQNFLAAFIYILIIFRAVGQIDGAARNRHVEKQNAKVFKQYQNRWAAQPLAKIAEHQDSYNRG